MAQKVDIENTDNLRKGSNFTIGFTVLDDNNDPVDITGWSLTYTWKVRDSDAAAVLTKTTANAIALTDPTNGVGTITLVPADTASLKPRVYVHSLARTDTGFAGSIIPGEGQRSALVTLRP
jgi:hypothetical protein